MGKLKDSINDEFLKYIEYLNIVLNNKMSVTALSGVRKSRANGISLEFSDFREYVFGDDIRNLDWNSYARFDKLFIKVFEEEKQASINVFVDCSNSMSDEFDKSVFSKKIALAIIYIALKNIDSVNIFAFSDDIISKKLKISSISKFYDAVDFLDNIKNNGGTCSKSFKRSFYDIKNKGICYILSDFFFDDDYKKYLNFLLYKKQKVCCIQTLSNFDTNPDFYGNLKFIDSEYKNNIDITVTPFVINQYKKALSDFQNDISQFCIKKGIKFVYAHTDKSIFKIILESL